MSGLTGLFGKMVTDQLRPYTLQGVIDHRDDVPECFCKWWRYDASFADDRSLASLTAYPYIVIRWTEASVWINPSGYLNGPGLSERRIGRDWSRKWAYPTKKEAFAGWRVRFLWRQRFHNKEAERIAALARLLADQ